MGALELGGLLALVSLTWLGGTLLGGIGFWLTVARFDAPAITRGLDGAPRVASADANQEGERR
jgi:hypothetical protein